MGSSRTDPTPGENCSSSMRWTLALCELPSPTQMEHHVSVVWPRSKSCHRQRSRPSEVMPRVNSIESMLGMPALRRAMVKRSPGNMARAANRGTEHDGDDSLARRNEMRRETPTSRRMNARTALKGTAPTPRAALIRRSRIAVCRTPFDRQSLPAAAVAPGPSTMPAGSRHCISRTSRTSTARRWRKRLPKIATVPRAVQSRQSISSNRAVSAALMSRSSCPRLAGTLHRSSFPGSGRTS